MNTDSLIDDGRPVNDIVAEHFRCDCQGTTRLTVFTASNRTTHLRRQCSRCGVFKAVRKDEVSPLAAASAAPFEQAIYDAWVNAQHRAGSALLAARRERARSESLADFRDDEAGFLGSPRWAEMRRLVLRRAGGTCEGCLVRPATQVHHVHYARKFGREMLFDLRAVCDDCHRAIHDPADLRTAVVPPVDTEFAPD